MQSNGNDFLITEDIKLVSKTKELSDRIKNIGFDQLLFFQNKEIPILQVFNADGSEADNCINGLRCIAFLYALNNEAIYIKDRKFNGGPVILGHGNANFDISLKKLNQVGYAGPYIMQAFRDEEGLQIFKRQLKWFLEKRDKIYAC